MIRSGGLGAHELIARSEFCLASTHYSGTSGSRIQPRAGDRFRFILNKSSYQWGVCGPPSLRENSFHRGLVKLMVLLLAKLFMVRGVGCLRGQGIAHILTIEQVVLAGLFAVIALHFLPGCWAMAAASAAMALAMVRWPEPVMSLLACYYLLLTLALTGRWSYAAGEHSVVRNRAPTFGARRLRDASHHRPRLRRDFVTASRSRVGSATGCDNECCARLDDLNTMRQRTSVSARHLKPVTLCWRISWVSYRSGSAVVCAVERANSAAFS